MADFLYEAALWAASHANHVAAYGHGDRLAGSKFAAWIKADPLQP
jgi:hypothetical protein